MTDSNFETRFSVARDPMAVFNAIIDTRAWWSGNIEGSTRALGDVFTYRYKHLHYSKQQITALEPGRRVQWQVLEAVLNFVADRTEWTGTTIVFDILARGETTELVFSHIGLRPDVECYDACSDAWSALIRTSLRQLIETGSTDLLELDATG